MPLHVKPTAALSVTPVNQNPWIASKGIYVQNYSGFNASLSGVAGASSYIIGYRISGANAMSYEQTLSVSNITGSGIYVIEGVVTDARDREDSDTVSIAVHPYSPPAISSIRVSRGTYSNGKWSASDTGPDVIVQYVVSLSLSIFENTANAEFKFNGTAKTADYGTYSKIASGTEYSAVFLAVNNEISYDLSITCTDSVGASSKPASVTLPTISVTMEFNSSGKGIAFNKTSEKDAFECNLPSEFLQSVDFSMGPTIEGKAVPYIVESGTSGIWTYRKWSDGMAECWGMCECTNVLCSNVWGSMYESDVYGCISYPFTFIERPMQQLSISTAWEMGLMLEYPQNALSANTQNTGGWWFVRPAVQSAAGTACVDIYVRGKWKTEE